MARPEEKAITRNIKSEYFPFVRFLFRPYRHLTLPGTRDAAGSAIAPASKLFSKTVIPGSRGLMLPRLYGERNRQTLGSCSVVLFGIKLAVSCLVGGWGFGFLLRW